MATVTQGNTGNPASWSQYTAIDKLEAIRRNRGGFIQDVQKNWAGWVFSLVFHVSLIVLASVMVKETVQDVNAFLVETAYTDNPIKINEQPLENETSPFDSNVESDVDDTPSVISDARNDLPTAGYSELAPGAPDYLTVGGGLTGIGQGGGHGGDHLAGKGFRGHVNHLKQTGLEVVICFDATGSMASPLLETKTRIRQMMSVVTYLVPDARLGLVSYRDTREHDPAEYEYTTRTMPLTQDIKGLEAFLRKTEAHGGGDIPEAVYEGLEAAMALNWNQGSTKVIIVFGDAPPHPENDGLNKVNELARSWHKRTGGVISLVDVGEVTGESSGGHKVMPEFKDIAAAAGGDASLLSDERELIRQMVVYIFGKEYKADIDKVYDQVIKGPADVKIIEGGGE